MAGFPWTEVDGISVPRLVCGSNWIPAYKAEEVIGISLACLDRRQPRVDIQFTQSKCSVLAQQTYTGQ